MSDAIIQKVKDNFTKEGLPEIKVGQTVEIDTIIRDKEKQRIQKFRGLVIKIGGMGLSKSFVVRKISYGIGVEKTFPMNTPNISKIRVLKYEPVRRSKLYFMRARVGKAAMRIRKGRSILVPQEGFTPIVEEETVDTSIENNSSKA